MVYDEGGTLLNEGFLNKKVSEEVKQIYKDDILAKGDEIINIYDGASNNGDYITKKYQDAMIKGFRKMVAACKSDDDLKFVIKKVQWEISLEKRGKRPSNEYIAALTKIGNGCRLSMSRSL